MPKSTRFVSVRDVERPMLEQDANEDEMLKHRRFDNPHALLKAPIGDKDVGAQSAKYAASGSFVKNEKGMWVPAKRVRTKKRKEEKEDEDEDYGTEREDRAAAALKRLQAARRAQGGDSSRGYALETSRVKNARIPDEESEEDQDHSETRKKQHKSDKRTSLTGEILKIKYMSTINKENPLKDLPLCKARLKRDYVIARSKALENLTSYYKNGQNVKITTDKICGDWSTLVSCFLYLLRKILSRRAVRAICAGDSARYCCPPLRSTQAQQMRALHATNDFKRFALS
eukprot:g65795.t1